MTKPCDRGAVCAAILGLMMLLPVQAATAEVQAFTDKAEWIEAVGDFAFIDFVGIPGGTFLSDEFEQLGVNFTPGQNYVLENALYSDGIGVLAGPVYSISFTLAEPQYWVAVDYPGAVQFELFLGDDLVCESQIFSTFLVDIDFAGLVSTTPFDKVVIQDPYDATVGMDNLYIGTLERSPDVNGDDVVDILDLIAVLLAWGTADPAADVTNDGIVDVADLVEVISNWS